MFRRTIVFISMGLMMAWAVPMMAQDDANTPQAAVDAALSAVEAQVGTRAGSFTFQFLGDTTDSSLGCPLIQGEELPYTINAIQVTVIYPDAQYTVYSSISGQTVLLCDSQFSDEVIGEQLNAEDACTVTPIQALPAYEAPNITLDGVFTANTEPYPAVGVSSDGGWYQVASDVGLGWIEATSVTATGDCSNLPTTSVTNPVAEGVCFITPQGGFTNVRSVPEGDLVGRIYENEVYQITARNTQATWFYIQPAGWVSNTVIFQLGDCNAIPVNDNAVGVGFAVDDGSLDTDAAVILERFACPADFAGYLQPRISIGQGTAQVEAGNVPNTLRGFPSVDDNEAPRIGVIQPSRVIDRVIAGPACNQGFVWWLVEIDETVGWTAESNQSSNDYFLEPTGETTTPADDAPTDTITVGENPVQEVFFNLAGDRLFARSSEQGFGDAQLGVVSVLEVPTGDAIARIEEPSGIVDVDRAIGTFGLMVAAGNGTITFYDMETLEQTSRITGIFTTEGPVYVETLPDAGHIVLVACADDACANGQVRVVSMSDAEIVATAPLSQPLLDMTISADGQTLALVTASGITFHRTLSLELLSTWENSDGFALDSIALSDNGESALAAGCNDAACSEGRIGLVTVADGSLVGVVPSHEAAATTITYSIDDARFATVEAESGQVIERNAATGEETQRFNVTDATIISLAYAAENRFIAAGTADGRVRLLTPAR